MLRPGCPRRRRRLVFLRSFIRSSKLATEGEYMTPAFSRILLAYDESEASRMALRYTCGLAESGAALAVTHAMRESNFIASAATAGGFPPIDPKSTIDAVDESGDFVLKAAVHACGALGIAAEKVFAHGPPVDAVIGAERQMHADLIVVGTHARKGIARAVHGSVAESICERVTYRFSSSHGI